jgi:hypothetical protein
MVRLWQRIRASTTCTNCYPFIRLCPLARLSVIGWRRCSSSLSQVASWWCINKLVCRNCKKYCSWIARSQASACGSGIQKGGSGRPSVPASEIIVLGAAYRSNKLLFAAEERPNNRGEMGKSWETRDKPRVTLPVACQPLDHACAPVGFVTSEPRK